MKVLTHLLFLSFLSFSFGHPTTQINHKEMAFLPEDLMTMKGDNIGNKVLLFE
jgi:hypothetical protein